MPPISSIVDQPNLLATQQGAEAPAKTSPTKAEEKAYAWGNGDTVTLSDEGRKLSEAAAQKANTSTAEDDKVFHAAATAPQAVDLHLYDHEVFLQKTTTITTKSGATVKLSRDENSKDQSALQADITLKNGTTQSVTITGNTILTETQDGFVVNGKPEYTDYGKPILVSNDEDDIIFNYTQAIINSGGGNDTIFNFAKTNTQIDSGAGNDSIYTGEIASTLINTGSGDDYINVKSLHYNSIINSGSGNDTIVSDIATGTINTNEGDDTITASFLGWSVDTGDGDDTITAKQISGTIYTGDGNDTVHAHLIGQSHKSMIEEYVHTTIDTQDGNDTIVTTDVNGASLLTGAGDDTIIATGNISNAYIDMGSGADTLITLGNIFNSQIFTSSNSITFNLDKIKFNINSEEMPKFIQMILMKYAKQPQQ